MERGPATARDEKITGNRLPLDLCGREGKLVIPCIIVTMLIWFTLIFQAYLCRHVILGNARKRDNEVYCEHLNFPHKRGLNDIQDRKILGKYIGV